MDQRVTPPKRVASSMWAPPAPWEQAVRLFPCKVNQAPESENFLLVECGIRFVIYFHSFLRL